MNWQVAELYRFQETVAGLPHWIVWNGSATPQIEDLSVFLSKGFHHTVQIALSRPFRSKNFNEISTIKHC
jgi:hypothetical protein